MTLAGWGSPPIRTEMWEWDPPEANSESISAQVAPRGRNPFPLVT